VCTLITDYESLLMKRICLTETKFWYPIGSEVSPCAPNYVFQSLRTPLPARNAACALMLVSVDGRVYRRNSLPRVDITAVIAPLSFRLPPHHGLNPAPTSDTRWENGKTKCSIFDINNITINDHPFLLFSLLSQLTPPSVAFKNP
jgi:hypothetical protein